MLTQETKEIIEKDAADFSAGIDERYYNGAYTAYIAGATKYAEKVEKLEKEVENLKSVMIAAAEELQAHWHAHCDEEGYGPANLMNRLEKGIPASYAYKAGDFANLRAQLTQLQVIEGIVNNDTVKRSWSSLKVALGIYAKLRKE